MTKTQTVQIFWTIFLANVITPYHYTVCKVYKQYIVRIAISRSIFERYFERKIKKVLDEYETSEQFITARNQIENTYKVARSSLKKRNREEKQ